MELYSIRQFVRWGLAALLLAGCAASAAPPRPAAARPARDPQFPSEEQRMMACLDLCDHIVDLYADEYVAEQGMDLSRTQRALFRHGWAEELARKGTFDRFEQSCFYGLTPRKYQCGMASTSTDGLVACMKLTSR